MMKGDPADAESGPGARRPAASVHLSAHLSYEQSPTGNGADNAFIKD